MAAVWDESDLRDGFRVVLVCVDKLLRYEILGFVVAGEFDIQVYVILAWPVQSYTQVHIPVGTCIYVLPW